MVPKSSPSFQLRNKLSAGFACTLKWYDFVVYTNLGLLMGELFFPVGDPLLSLIYVYGAFAIGFLGRPLGGVVFGMIGEAYGRKMALLASVSLMSVASLAIGFLPDFSVVGWYAPAAIILFRFLQGVSTGGGNILVLCSIWLSWLPKVRRRITIAGA
ncbi:MFS transporter [Endozoicomonas numazuensis]|uniref:Major facilitator superfamily (MFS) profile domain-containing protein n=1 Tax=Endozoicomonas numazuensis TaxID=1137799 RepID=A0A081NHM1_9GAMM|nr:MFS transporter [Endozoicomonas numazuensis]KEQ17944.1 hypothetical protein GZ78_10015 [Endozoicomonas numazuensis]